MSYIVDDPVSIAEPLTSYKIRIIRDWGNYQQTEINLDDSNIVSIDISNSCFTKSELTNANILPVSVGQANAGEITFSFLSSAGVVYMTSLCRITIKQKPHGSPFAQLWTEKQVATYRVDQVTVDTMTGITTVHGFDKMSDLDRDSFRYLLQTLEGNHSDIDIIDNICIWDNFVKDSSVTNAITRGYTIPESIIHGTSARELMAQIAGAYGGAFYLKPDPQDIYREILAFTDIIPKEYKNYLSVWSTTLGGHQRLEVGGDHIIVRGS